MVAQLKPVSQVKACTIQIPGSKSASNRLLILQALFPNITIENLSTSHDTRVLKKGLEINSGVVDIHHAGTAMRFLTAYFAAKPGANVVLTASTKIIDVTQEQPQTLQGEVPPASVVIPGAYTKTFPAGDFQVPCALIIGKRKASTNKKTSLNEALRTYNVAV